MALPHDSMTTGYRYLVERPQSHRRQLYLQGRNMSVGQLVATMRANRMSAQEIAQDLHLPLAQVWEALEYYVLNSGLVDEELREDRIYLEERGYLEEKGGKP